MYFFLAKWPSSYECCRSSAMLPWKKKFLYFYFLGDLVFSVMDKYHLNLVMVFDLAFQMKCKYKLSKSANVPQMSSIHVHIFFYLHSAAFLFERND